MGMHGASVPISGRNSQFLFDHITLHTQGPQRLGQGRMSLAGKVGGHVHSTLLGANRPEEVRPILDSYFVWCAVMGTESALPDF